jgi:hypothetical protein
MVSQVGRDRCVYLVPACEVSRSSLPIYASFMSLLSDYRLQHAVTFTLEAIGWLLPHSIPRHYFNGTKRWATFVLALGCPQDFSRS